jgi:hypothetical protein
MAGPENPVAVPRLEDVMSEVVTTLAIVAHAYLEPHAEGVAPDLDAAGIAIDTAGAAFERIGPRLSMEQHAALSELLTDIRLTFVRKRGS